MESNGMTFRLMAGLCLLAVSACSGVPQKPLEEPKVFVRNFEVTNVTLGGIEGIIGLDVDNPNDVNLSANGLTYAMSISDQEVLTGQKEDKFSIPSLGTQTIELPVRISYLVLLEVMPEIMSKGVVDYTVTGSIKANLFQNIPFTKTGTFKLPVGVAQ